jgi:predicted phosphodiesterase
MRYAILSDIHSNLSALMRALSIIDTLRIDHIYCLGDIVGYGAQPNECVSLIRERATFSVLGNHDLGALDPKEARYFHRYGRIAVEWTNKVLAEENTAYLASLPYKYESDLFTLVHASPKKPQQWNYVMSVERAGLQFPHFNTQYCFIGHTHIPTVCGEDLQTFSFEKDKRFLINVGSIGQPRDGNPMLCFGILDTGKESFETIRAEYDVEQAARSILDAGLPAFLADRLFKGR